MFQSFNLIPAIDHFSDYSEITIQSLRSSKSDIVLAARTVLWISCHGNNPPFKNDFGIFRIGFKFRFDHDIDLWINTIKKQWLEDKSRFQTFNGSSVKYFLLCELHNTSAGNRCDFRPEFKVYHSILIYSYFDDWFLIPGIIEFTIIFLFQRFDHMISIFIVRHRDSKLLSHPHKRTGEHIDFRMTSGIQIL